MSLQPDPTAFNHEFCQSTSMVNTMEAAALPPEVAEFIEGVNFEDESFGEVLLQRSLERSKQLSLWWD